MHYNQDMNAPASRVEVAPQPPNNGYPILSYRAALLQRAQPRIPSTAEGLPVGYYRVDLLPTAYQKQQEEVQALRNAYADLSFEYGYPTLPDGRPFWYKLDFEPGFSYGAFQMYLEQLNEGPRELARLATNTELLDLINRAQPRADGKVWDAKDLNNLLYEFSILYNWRARAKAHDIYKEAAFRHLRLRRQSSVEEEDYAFASKILAGLKDQVFNQPKFLEDLKPREAADLLSKLIAIRRVSVGLPAAGPLSQKETPEDMTFEMIMRTLGQRANQGAVYENGEQQPGGGTKGILDSILSDPKAAEQMQEVIIRVTRAQRERALPDPHDQNRGHVFKGRNRARTQELISGEDLQGPYDLTGAPGENTNEEPPLVG